MTTTNNYTNSFLIVLKDYLSRIMGPVAEVMIDDEIKQMEEEKQSMLFERVPDLIIFLSDNIPDIQKKEIFLKDMVEIIKDFKKLY